MGNWMDAANERRKSLASRTQPATQPPTARATVARREIQATVRSLHARGAERLYGPKKP